MSQGEQLSRPPAIREVAENGDINMARAQPTIMVRAKPMSVKPILVGTIVATRAVPIATGCSPTNEGTIIKSIIEPIKRTGYCDIHAGSNLGIIAPTPEYSKAFERKPAAVNNAT